MAPLGLGFCSGEKEGAREESSMSGGPPYPQQEQAARHGDSGGCGGDERVGEVLGRYRDEDDDPFLKKPLAAFFFNCKTVLQQLQ